ncbi:hypothetical protein F5148DRAFT_1185861 [Russula earlei]|uniref:Uncharacterized protein n=1 Tax=Russula earlei TaxID=71964 RepID=A0ACC0UDJ9_9AGAM|nr:hypothetical protein F5148DRAFT_1185861 [Russula earlei]
MHDELPTTVLPRRACLIIALDTDWTIWHGILNHTTWGKGAAAFSPVQDNITPVTDQSLQDRM